MTKLLQRDSRVVTGSNVKGSALALWNKALAGRSRELAALERTFRAHRSRLIKPADRRTAAKWVREANASWQRAALAAGPDAERRAWLKREAGKKLQQRLVRSLPGYRECLALKKKYLRERQAILARPLSSYRIGALSVQLDTLPPLTQEVEEFVAPFPRYEIVTGDLLGLLQGDTSYIRPETGQLAQNFVFEHDDSGWLVTSSSTFVDHLISCGIDFTVPVSGRLQVSAEIENFANRLNCSISDHFGFSHSNLQIWVNLFVVIIRPNQPGEYLEARLIDSRFHSGGDDLSRSISDLATFEPYAVGGITLRPLPAGETVTILAGAHVRVDSDTDDMDAEVRASYWWHVRKLAVSVV